MPIGEPLHRALIRSGVLELQATLFSRSPELLERGPLGVNPQNRVSQCSALEGEGAKSSMARNLHIGVAMKVRSVMDALQLR